MRRFVLLLLVPILSWAEPSHKAWVSFEVPQARELAVVKAIEARGATAIAWSNAVVDISVFQNVEPRPLATLNQTLTPADPRWDPWLKELDAVFHPRPGTARVWVDAEQKDDAAAVLGQPRADRGPVPPRAVTGWMLVAAALFYFFLRFFGQGWPDWQGGVRAWVWLPSAFAVVLVGSLMIWGGPSGPVSGGPAASKVAWSRHRWYQESLPYGASWDDWADGKAWSYPQVEKKNGRLAESVAALPAADAAWAQAAFEGLDGHQAGRIFGIGNP